ncbi:MAG: NUDIX hydrolase [Firmicutes bacterium]|nr:NUDIX hydrolase [Bacillota bacterium]
MSDKFSLVESDLIFKGAIISLYADKIKSPSGRIMEREVVKHLDAVGIAALTNKEEMVFVRQYRHAVKDNLLEIPAGLITDAESPIECAIRELKEETGYLAKSMDKLVEFYTSAGFTDEKLILFFTDEIEEGEPAREPGEEGMELKLIPLRIAIEMVSRGEVQDAKTLIAILLAAQKLGWIKPQSK